MATIERQKVKFTGKRTGLAAISIKGIGRVEQGDTVEVNADEAERWTEKLPMRDGKEGSDFVKVGGPIKVDADEVQGRVLKQRERNAADDDPRNETEANVELAHGINPDTGTAEQDAEALRVQDAAEGPA